METYAHVLYQSLRLLFLVILRKLSRFVDYIYRNGQFVFHQQTLYKGRIQSRSPHRTPNLNIIRC